MRRIEPVASWIVVDVNWLTALSEADSHHAAKGDIAACLHAIAPLRAAAVRARLAGFELAEISEMYGWPQNKAFQLLSRGLDDLRQLLVERGVSVG